MTNEELNEAVAKVRGDSPSIIWQAMNDDETGIYITFDNWMDAKSWQVDKFHLDPNAHKAHLVKREVWRNYSKNIAAAWELVEEILSTHNYTVSLDIQAADLVFAKIFYWNDVYNDSAQLFHEQADTAPRAICLAYLAWKAAQS